MSFSKSKRNKVFDKYDGKCAYCGEVITIDLFHIEHIKPKSQGGDNDHSNLNPSCVDCNLSKGPLNLEEFRIKIFELRYKARIKMFIKFHKVDLEKDIKFYFEK